MSEIRKGQYTGRRKLPQRPPNPVPPPPYRLGQLYRDQDSGELRVNGMCKAEMLDHKIRIAMIEVKQMFCEHKHTTRVFVEQSNERITCNDCDKVWYD